MINYLKKYCYICIPLITIVLILIFWIVKIPVKVSFADNLSENLIQISGTLIGFLLTAITIFLSLPKDTKIMQRVKKYKHHLIFSRCIFFGSFFLILSIMLWLVKVPDKFVLIAFLLGLEETIISVYYIYKLCIYNFE